MTQQLMFLTQFIVLPCLKPATLIVIFNSSTYYPWIILMYFVLQNKYRLSP